jgi:hypothetical protein
LDIKAKGDELDAKAQEFFAALRKLASEAGGEAPLPARPSIRDIEDIERLIGNDCLAALRGKDSDLKARIAAWKKTRELIARRQPAWQTVERMAAHAAAMAEAQSTLAQIEAIRANRLLSAEPDPAAPLRAALADLLRQSLNATQSAHEAAYARATEALAANDTWQQIAAEDQARILTDVGLEAPSKLDVGSDAALLAALDSSNLAARKAEAEAVPARLAKVLQQAAQLLEPRVQFVSLERSVLKTEADVDGWLARQRRRLLEALKRGPVQTQ